MSWEITPFQSVGPLQLGSHRDDVRRQLGPPFTTFTKDVAENESDAYDDLGIHLYYTDDDRLECVEAFEPASLTLKDVSLLARDYDDVAKELAEHGYKADPTDIGYCYADAGVALGLSGREVDCVTAFRKDYYED